MSSLSRSNRLAALVPPASSLILPRGFQYTGISCGIKKKPIDKNDNPPLDLALIYSSTPCTVAACFTTNLFQAAPVKVSREIITKNHHQHIHSVIINSGCANACTGILGDQDAFNMIQTTSNLLHNKNNNKNNNNKKHDTSDLPISTLVMSTGVIGQRLPMNKILSGIPKAIHQLDNNGNDLILAAKAIMTTDTFPKYLTRTYTLPESKLTYTLAGICKGAGMIHPRMSCIYPSNQGTMLSVITTDLNLTPNLATDLLHTSIHQSFNAISVDGDTSTNDTVLLLANGNSNSNHHHHLIPFNFTSTDHDSLKSNFNQFSRELAARLVWDGEGATKFITIRVKSHDTIVSKKIASTVATSPLVKTAFYGQDANWGRILCAVGYTELNNHDKLILSPDKVSLTISSNKGHIHLVNNGIPNLPIDENLASLILQQDIIDINVDMGTGNQIAEYDFCDLSHDYISINADYRS